MQTSRSIAQSTHLLSYVSRDKNEVLVDLNPSYVDKEQLLPTIMSEVSYTTIENKHTSNRKLHKVESKKFDIAPISIVRDKKNISSFGDLLTER